MDIRTFDEANKALKEIEEYFQNREVEDFSPLNKKINAYIVIFNIFNKDIFLFLRSYIFQNFIILIYYFLYIKIN